LAAVGVWGGWPVRGDCLSIREEAASVFEENDAVAQEAPP
jgi:hypothetical protein